MSKKRNDAENRWKKRQSAIAISSVVGLLMVYVSYLLSNVPTLIGNEHNILHYFWEMRDMVDEGGECTAADSVLLVNVAYDRQLVAAYDENGFEIGNIDITDRAKLLKLLQVAERYDTYRYILLDVRFEQGHETECDSALFAQIRRMERIVIPRHADMAMADSSLMAKSALADYTITILNNDFSKYEIVNTDMEYSVAMKMYHDLWGSEVTNFGGSAGLYFMNGRLIRRSIVPDFYLNVDSEKGSGLASYENLGDNILSRSDEDIAEMIRGRYVVVGDMVNNDNHSTITGRMPGSLIIVNAYLSLLDGNQNVSWVVAIVMWMVFSLVTYVLIMHVSFWTEERAKQMRLGWAYAISQNDWVRMTFRFVGGWPIVLAIVLVALFMFGETIEVLILVAIFAFIKKIINLITFIRNKKQQKR